MNRYFNIGGPCNAADHYMLPAAERLPEVMRLISKKQYFVIHAQRQCGKTTAFQALAREINAKGEMAALYLTVEDVQEFTDPREALPQIAAQIRVALDTCPEVFDPQLIGELRSATASEDCTTVVKVSLHLLAQKCGKPLVVFFDEVDCLSGSAIVSFLRQLWSGKIGYNNSPGQFPISIALIGMRNIRDYKMRVRPESESTGEASPFNVLTKAMTLNLFTKEEVATLYAQHTAETGQAIKNEQRRHSVRVKKCKTTNGANQMNRKHTTESNSMTTNLNRRDFLSSLMFAGGAAALGGCRAFSCGGKDNLTVFVSDVHVGTESAYQLEYFHKVVDSILAMRPLPKRVVCFGDIAYLRGPIADYRVSRPEFDRLISAGIELTFGMGNHDRRDNFLEVWPEYRSRLLVQDRIVSEVDLGDCDLIMLDTLHQLDELATENERKQGWTTPGQFKGAQLEWLKAELKRRTRPFFLAAHHAVNEVTDGDWKVLNDLVVKTPLCIGWIHGHDHAWRTSQIKDSNQSWWGKFISKRVLTLPSTGHWGDIGYVRFTTSANSARAEMEMMDHFFPVPSNHNQRDNDFIAERRNSFMTFRW